MADNYTPMAEARPKAGAIARTKAEEPFTGVTVASAGQPVYRRNIAPAVAYTRIGIST